MPWNDQRLVAVDVDLDVAGGGSVRASIRPSSDSARLSAHYRLERLPARHGDAAELAVDLPVTSEA